MFSSLRARIRSLWHAVTRRSDVESEMSEEFRSHLELRTADLIRRGHPPAEAARQARLEFGSAERYKDEARESRGLDRINSVRVSWLDFKLGFRMLARYPGLTLVGGLAMAFAIWTGAVTFELFTQLVRPTMPFDEGARIVGVRVWDAQRNRSESRILHDFDSWRTQVKSIDDLGAFRTVQRNLFIGDASGEPIEIAEISPSAFRVTRVAPVLGRALTEADATPGAAPVIVIGHELWQRLFDGDPEIVGRQVRIGAEPTTVVGVMPADYAFPISQNAWAPFRLGSGPGVEPRAGPAIHVFGRLAPDVSIAEARTELTELGRRAAADFRDTHEHLRPEVLPYAKSILDVRGWMMIGAVSSNIPVVLLLLLICANVALLMFARAATRESEIAIRTALGASRGRIIMQLFAEALVLGGVAAVIGLVAANTGIRILLSVVISELAGTRLPFWFTASLSPTTILYALLLTVIGAIIAGVVPGLKVTRGMGARLQQTSAGAGGLQFGGLWTAVIVVQIAVTVAFPAVAWVTRAESTVIRSIVAPFAAEEYLSLRLEMDRSESLGAPVDTSRAAAAQRFRAAFLELEARLQAEPDVAGVTYADLLPRMYHPHRLIEMDSGGAAPLHPHYPNGYRVSEASVEPDYFAVLGTPILAGRGFHTGDLGEGVMTVLVNESFVQRVLGERNPIGRRLRFVSWEEDEAPAGAEAKNWYEIVGVVRDLGMAAGNDPKVAGIYHPAAAGSLNPVHVAVHVKGDPERFVPRLRAIASATDPRLRIYDVQVLADLSQSELEFVAFWFRILLAVSLIVLVLSLAGIYAVMAFTVTRRTREIGIRVALGASRGRVVRAIFVRPLMQVSGGIVLGACILVFIASEGGSRLMSLEHAIVLVGYSVLMLLVCLTACIVPTRRALRVEPTEALRSEG